MTPYDRAVLLDKPVGYWKLNETSGTTVNDSSGNGHSGTYILDQSSLLAGEAGSPCGFFSTAYAYIPYTSAWFPGVPITIEWWQRCTNTGTNGLAICSGAASGGSNILEVYAPFSDGNIYFDCGDNSGPGPGRVFTSMPSSTSLAHVVCTAGGGVMAIWVNGTSILSVGKSPAWSPGTGNFFIGRRDDTGLNYFAGYIQNMAVYNKVLPSSAIGYHHTVGLDVRNGVTF